MHFAAATTTTRSANYIEGGASNAKSGRIHEENRKAGRQRPTAPPAVRVEQWDKQRIVVPEEERGSAGKAFPAFLFSS